MRIKHWQGYGAVNAKRISKDNKQIIIEVSGNHEYGLAIGEWDIYGMSEWLGKIGKFKKENVLNFTTNCYLKDNPENTEEVCEYIINLKEESKWQ